MTLYEKMDLTKPQLKQIGRRPIQADELHSALLVANEPECEAIVRLLVTETLPRAFENFPLMFEFARQVLADKLDIHPKHVCLTGSARLGFATPVQKSEGKAWGRPLTKASDLDFFVVSEELFKKCCHEVVAVTQGKHKSRKPTHDERSRQLEHWAAKATSMLRPAGPLERGFFDTKHMPMKARPPLEVTTSIRDATKTLHARWKTLDFDLLPKDPPSMRLYKNWHAAICQISISLRKAARQCAG